jgi:hypothetical protein
MQQNGPITFTQIQNEFGGSKPISLGEYYQDAPTNYTVGISGIPFKNNPIKMGLFYSKSKVPIAPTPPPYNTSITARYANDSYYLTTDTNNTITQWYDSSGNGNHITSSYFRGNVKKSTFTQGSKGLKGTSTLTTITGTINDGLYFPFALTQGSYTFCYVARYKGDKNNTTYNRRIFESRMGVGQNIFWGFGYNMPGYSYNGVKQYDISDYNNKQSEPEWWIIGVETEITARYNGMDCTDKWDYQTISLPPRPDSGTNPTPSINFGTYTGQSTDVSQTSDWEVLELIFYNRELTTLEQIDVETYLANKFKHISFSNVSLNFNEFKTNCESQIVLYDLFNFIYKGYKWGYGINYLQDYWYGPGIKYSLFYKYANRFYWIVNLQGWLINYNYRKYSLSYDRNQRNVKYNLHIPDYYTDSSTSFYNYTVHGIINGGGGGGSTYGGGAGGQIYFSYAGYEIRNADLFISIGSGGYSSVVDSTNLSCSAGGDTIISWESGMYNLTAKGGYEGDTGQGGSFIDTPATVDPFTISAAVGGQGGAINTYNYLDARYNFYGGRISTSSSNLILYNDTNLNPVSIWSIINNESITGINSYSDIHDYVVNKYGAGGRGYSSDPDMIASSYYPNGIYGKKEVLDLLC